MTDHINWGIIGCGNVTEKKSGPAFNKVPNSSLVAVMRRNANKAQDYATRHGVPKWYSNAQQLINDPQVNAVYIATPPSTHMQYTLDCIAANKPVYVEKPMALNYSEAVAMDKAAIAANTKLSVAHYRRQLPVFKKIRSLLHSKEIGKILMVDMKLYQSAKKNMIANTDENWRINPAISGGGLFHDLAPHQLDLMYYFFGEASHVSGYAANRLQQQQVADTILGNIVFNNGILYNGAWCFSVADDEVTDQCRILGSKGQISFSVFAGDIEVSVNGHVQHYSFAYPGHVQQPMIEKVVQYFIGKNDNPCTAAEGATIIQWMDKMTTQTSK